MQLIDIPIPPEFSTWLERVSWVEIAPDEQMPVFAGARVNLLFVVDGEVRVDGIGDACMVAAPVCWGPMRSAGVVRCGSEAARGWLVKLAGGAAPAVLGISAEALAARIQPLSGLWPHLSAEALGKQADRGLATVLAWIAAAIGRWEDRLLWSPGQCLRVMGLIDSTPVAQLASQLGISKATLERRTWAAFGLPPKGLARVQRLYRSLAMIDAANDADLAAQAGFFDQSHFIADFRQLTGTTPAQFRRLAVDRPQLLSLYNAADLTGGIHGG
ncbi:helix-turn-helix domain-containing protein [Niveibacterium sp. COAC-50]|uniref:helix-turn-helix domain-containing protein n=1 Tax=Niveibacterium sp. COAC-50 TaxID=2729384 RepID=UPI001554BCEA|nr:helix-turn-helix domain-containing protein [Niveibacterium sp. COAC-50]